MVKVVGLDLGTKSFDVFGLENGEVFLEKSIPTETIVKNPSIAVDLLKKYTPLDLVVAPSGHGLPLTHVDKIGWRELSLITLIKPDDRKIPSQVGLRSLLKMLKASGLNVYVIPSIKLLPTIPSYRKINKIDMGTADKLCAVALALKEQAEKFKINFNQVSFILAELGFGYNAYIAVKNGKVVDGVGGSLSLGGFLSQGCLDAEAAYLIGKFKKEMVGKGGVAFIVGMKKPSVEDFIGKVNKVKSFKVAWKFFIENVEKNVSQMLVSAGKPAEIILSGRLSKNDKVFFEISRRLSVYAPVTRLKGFTFKVKDAAQGAALIADGLAGGRYRKLVECLQIKKAKGTVLDYVYIDGWSKVKKMFKAC
ncbi:MAG: DUF1464 family protein [Candidatus Bathyarchaeota archaeon]|nr:DUF1464 family protein [Candidatus Bathyarchaeota archaeon]